MNRNKPLKFKNPYKHKLEIEKYISPLKRYIKIYFERSDRMELEKLIKDYFLK